MRELKNKNTRPFSTPKYIPYYVTDGKGNGGPNRKEEVLIKRIEELEAMLKAVNRKDYIPTYVTCG